MRRWIVAGIVVLGALCVWLLLNRQALQRKKANTERLAQECQQDGPSEEQFEVKLPSHKPYRAAEYEVLLSKYAGIKAGQTHSEVRNLIGTPSYVQPNVDKDGVGYKGCFWIYMLERDIDRENEKDALISVYFNPEGRVSSHFRKHETWFPVR